MTEKRTQNEQVIQIPELCKALRRRCAGVHRITAIVITRPLLHVRAVVESQLEARIPKQLHRCDLCRRGIGLGRRREQIEIKSKSENTRWESCFIPKRSR